MFTKTFTYTDYNGEERKETKFFDLNEAEIMEMEMTTEGGLADTIQKVVDAKNTAEIIRIFKALILKAYGEKSADGRRFIKSENLAIEFSQTPMYSMLFMELATDADKASAFVNGIMPEVKGVETPVALPNA